ncbi:hypothetical protein K439DRAFT_1370977 [Ramaria rubella]|nr:hypothetical protein K439DRAFT_1370977 [Ramaria rubella]
MVQEIDADITRTVLPSWVAASPSKFGSSKHGKLKADEWHTTALIRLAISFPRLWGPLGGRHTLMLDNFMHLVAVIIIGNALTIVHNPMKENGATKSTAAMYCEAFQSYLQGIIKLYPTAKMKPNMHMSYHIGKLLEKYGPVHSWRTFVFERFIGLIQNLPINMHFGELKHTFMRSFCMAVNMKALVTDSESQAIQDLRQTFLTAFAGDAQGLLLYHLLGLESKASETSRHEEVLSKAARK